MAILPSSHQQGGAGILRRPCLFGKSHMKKAARTPLSSMPCWIALAIQEASELAAPARMLEFAERLGLDLADTFAGDRELLADLFERVVGVHADAEAHAQHAFLAGRQRCQNAGCRLAEVRLDCRV